MPLVILIPMQMVYHLLQLIGMREGYELEWSKDTFHMYDSFAVAAAASFFPFTLRCGAVVSLFVICYLISENQKPAHTEACVVVAAIYFSVSCSLYLSIHKIHQRGIHTIGQLVWGCPFSFRQRSYSVDCVEAHGQSQWCWLMLNIDAHTHTRARTD